MDIELTDEQRMMQAMAREFAEKEVRPIAGDHRPRGALPARRRCAAWASWGSWASRCPEALRRQRRRHRGLRAGHGGAGPRVRVPRRHHVGQQLALLRPGAKPSAPPSSGSASSPPSPRAGRSAASRLTEPEAGSDAEQPAARWPAATASTTCWTAARCSSPAGGRRRPRSCSPRPTAAPAHRRHQRLPGRAGHARASPWSRPRTSSASAPPTPPSSCSRAAACRRPTGSGTRGRGSRSP